MSEQMFSAPKECNCREKEKYWRAWDCPIHGNQTVFKETVWVMQEREYHDVPGKNPYSDMVPESGEEET